MKHVLQYGIGFIFEGMDAKEKEIVEQLFGVGGIQILISTYKLCWELNQTSYCVIIMDTQRYDGQERRFVHFIIIIFFLFEII